MGTLTYKKSSTKTHNYREADGRGRGAERGWGKKWGGGRMERRTREVRLSGMYTVPGEKTKNKAETNVWDVSMFVVLSTELQGVK